MTLPDIQITHETPEAITYASSGNPRHPHLQAGFLTSQDHIKLRYAHLPAHTAHNEGTVILLHGRNECIEKYYETIDDLHMRGFHVATLDWRGQGHSDRLIKDHNRGFVRRFKDYADDLIEFIKTIVLRECPPPFYILAHSAGGLITLSAMPRLLPHIERIVLAAPLLGFDKKSFPDKSLRRLSRVLHFTGLGKTYARRGIKPGDYRNFDNNLLTSDPQRYQRNQQIIYDHPSLGLAGPSFTWMYNALHTIHLLNQPKSREEPKIPTLFILAGADKVVSSRMAEDYARHIRGATYMTIDGARHELMQEDDHYREQFWAAFDAFIPASVTKGSDQPK